MKKQQVKTSLYDVILLWNPYKGDDSYIEYCSSALNNLMGFNEYLSKKIIHEANNHNRSLILSTKNIEKAADIRNKLISLGIDCVISENNI